MSPPGKGKKEKGDHGSPTSTCPREMVRALTTEQKFQSVGTMESGGWKVLRKKWSTVSNASERQGERRTQACLIKLGTQK